MGSYTNVPTLMFLTLGIVLLVAIILYIRHRSKHGAHPMAHQRERNIDEIRTGKTPERE